MDGILRVILDKEVVLEYEKDLAIAEETINQNLIDQPRLFAFYAVLDEMADEVVASAKLTLEITEADVDKRVRERLVKEGGKYTETIVFNEVKLDDVRLKAIAEFNQAKAQAGKIHAIREAFAHRKDMLVTLASNMRMQMDSTNLSFKDKKERI